MAAQPQHEASKLEQQLRALNEGEEADAMLKDTSIKAVPQQQAQSNAASSVEPASAQPEPVPHSEASEQTQDKSRTGSRLQKIGSLNIYSKAPRYTEHSLLDMAVLGIFFMALIASMNYASLVLIPCTVGFLIFFLLSPLTEGLARKGIPRELSALAAILMLVLPAYAGVHYLWEPAFNWLREAPTKALELKTTLLEFSAPLQPVKDASEAVEKAMDDFTGGGSAQPKVVISQEPVLLKNVFNYFPTVIASILLSIAFGFLLLSGGRRPIYKLLIKGRTLSTGKKAIFAMRRIQTNLSRYLTTIVIINAALGLISTLCFWALGIPNPVMWGVIAGVFNFAPYLGSMVTTAGLLLVGITNFDTVLPALAPAACFIVLTALEGQLITPMILGRHLSIHPAMALFSVLLMAWLWGVAGALVAVPLLLIILSLARYFRESQAKSLVGIHNG